MEFTEVASGIVHKSALNGDDVFVFDTGVAVYVWIGKGASPQEKARYNAVTQPHTPAHCTLLTCGRNRGMGYAQDYVKKYNRPDYLPISRVYQGGENEVFEASFD
jgi:gelsolin